MSGWKYDTFEMDVNFIDNTCRLSRATVGLFKALDTTGIALAKFVKALLKGSGFTDGILAYVKDKGTNFNTLDVALMSSYICKPL